MSSNNSDAEKQNAKNLTLAQTEAHIMALADILAEERTGTRENVERKQARSAGEVEEEEEEEIVVGLNYFL